MDKDYVYVYSYDWIVQGNEEAVHIRALDQDGNTYCIRVVECFLHMRVILPLTNGRNRLVWKKNCLSTFQESFDEFLGLDENGDSYIKSISFDNELYPMYYSYALGKQPILNLRLKNANVRRKLIYAMCTGDNDRDAKIAPWDMFGTKIRLTVCEEDIPHDIVLRTELGVGPCSWLKFPVQKLDRKSRYFSPPWVRQYTVHYSKIQHASEIPIHIRPPMKVASMDIETYSSNRGSMPNTQNSEDVITMIATVIYTTDTKVEDLEGVVVVLGDCPELPPSPANREIGKIVIHNVQTEEELILKWFEILDTYHINCIIHFNGDEYDFDYINARLDLIYAKRSMDNDEEIPTAWNGKIIWPGVSQNKNNPAYLNSNDWTTRAGNRGTDVLMAEGIITFDMRTFITKGWRLAEYNLNYLANHFLKRKKHPVSAEQMFAIHERMQKEIARSERLQRKGKRYYGAQEALAEVVRYCIEDCVLPVLLFVKLNVWLTFCESAQVNRVTPMVLAKQGELRKFVAQLYHQTREVGVFMNVRVSEKVSYTGGHVEDPITGLHVVIVLDYQSMYPNIMITENLCYMTLLPPGMTSNDAKMITCTIHVPDPSGNDKKIEKREVVNSFYRRGVHKRTILPEIEQNLLNARKHIRKVLMPAVLTKLRPLEREEEDYAMLTQLFANCQLPEEQIAKMRRVCEDEDKTNTVAYRALCAYPELDAFRDEYRRLCETADDRHYQIGDLQRNYQALDVRQNQTKIAANSIYGGTGASIFKYYCVEIASAVTASGQKQIKDTSAILVRDFPGTENIYGDTDSVMVKNPETTEDFSRLPYWGVTYQQRINGARVGELDGNGVPLTDNVQGILEGTMAAEFEKAIVGIFLLAKNYVGYYVNPKGKILTRPVYSADGKIIGEERDLILRGVAPARRDHVAFENKLLMKLYRFILDSYVDKRDWTTTFREAIEMVYTHCLQVTDTTDYKYEDFTFVRKVGSKDDYFVKRFADKLRMKDGMIISATERLHYVVVDIGVNNASTVDRMMLVEAAIRDKAKLSVEYYLEKVSKQVEFLLNVCFPEQIAAYNGYFSYRPTSRGARGSYGLDRIISLFRYLYKDEKSIQSFQKYFRRTFRTKR